MCIDDKGVVLRCVKYDDKSFIAHLFTVSHGHVSFMVNGARGKRSGTAARLFQPLSLLSFQWEAKPLATLHRMKEARLLFVPVDIPLHPVKRAMAMLVAEFMAHALREESVNSDLYEYVEHSLRWLDIAERDFANFHLVFLLKLARFLGFAPNVATYEDGALFDLMRGCFVPDGVVSETVANAACASSLYCLAGSSYETMSAVAMSRQDRSALVACRARYFSLHIPKFPEIHSVEVMQMLFDEV